jgi:hypothetical protein
MAAAAWGVSGRKRGRAGASGRKKAPTCRPPFLFRLYQLALGLNMLLAGMLLWATNRTDAGVIPRGTGKGGTHGTRRRGDSVRGSGERGHCGMGTPPRLPAASGSCHMHMQAVAHPPAELSN